MRMTIGKKSGALALLTTLACGLAYSGLALWSSPAHADACSGDDPDFCYSGWIFLSRQVDHFQIESCNYECVCGDGSSRFWNGPCS